MGGQLLEQSETGRTHRTGIWHLLVHSHVVVVELINMLVVFIALGASVRPLAGVRDQVAPNRRRRLEPLGTVRTLVAFVLGRLVVALDVVAQVGRVRERLGARVALERAHVQVRENVISQLVLVEVGDAAEVERVAPLRREVRASVLQNEAARRKLLAADVAHGRRDAALVICRAVVLLLLVRAQEAPRAEFAPAPSALPSANRAKRQLVSSCAPTLSADALAFSELKARLRTRRAKQRPSR